jgi:uncharacterized membrane protein YgcG
MAHINFKRTDHGPAVTDEWLAATAGATQFATRLAARTDIAVKLGNGFAAGAGTAQFTPAIATIEVDCDVMLPGVKGEDVNLADDLFRARHPLFVGALVHECAHARFSRWVPMDLMYEGTPFTPRKRDVLVALEESRIEGRILDFIPGMRGALGAIVFDLIGKDFKVSDDAYGASIASALTLARVDAGSITKADAKPFREVIGTVLDDDTLATLRELWVEYHALPFDEYEPLPYEDMDSIATRWIEALGMDANDESGEGMSCEFAMEGAEGSEGGSEGSGGSEGGSEGSDGSESGSGGSGKSLSDKVKDAAAAGKHGKEMESAEKVGEIKAKRRKAQRNKDAERRAKGREAGEGAFGKPGKPKPTGREQGTGKHGFADTGGSRVTWRKPTDKERAAGVRLSRLLEKVIYTDKRVTKVKQVAPGGRMLGRGQVARVAERAAGQHATSAGWTVKKRGMSDTPKMKVAVALDVSGSMSKQAEIAGSLAYAVGNAVERTGGDFAMALFGREVLGLVKAGQKLDVVPVINASCGWENFEPAFFALDDDLSLVDSDGLRVLILLSDGVFVHEDQAKAADAILPMLASKGVVIVHVDIDGVATAGPYSGYNPTHHNPYPALVIPRKTDALTAANLIGETLVQLVKQAKKVAA